MIAAALELFRRYPFEEISLTAIAESAGGSRALVYHYFGGKQGLYDEVMHRAGTLMCELFEEPMEGPASERLSRVMGRYLEFTARHRAGFLALLRGGAATQTTSAAAVIGEVRRRGEDEIFRHLGLVGPREALRRAVQGWIAAVEAASLNWLSDLTVPLEEVQLQLTQDLIAAVVVAAARDAELATELGRFFAVEREDGPVAQLVRQLAGLAGVPEVAREVCRLAAPVPPPAPRAMRVS
ncbi:TetR/AcrR family transcriptional regulator (plasmid) [Kitasatospora sp. NBC_00070]|uniref:TetR/AcrR family transcriptional regulator n=1 Tax=Kitasatospora sp. NBC_00070 TaxID=2975962 RepID=UPI002F91327A